MFWNLIKMLLGVNAEARNKSGHAQNPAAMDDVPHVSYVNMKGTIQTEDEDTLRKHNAKGSSISMYQYARVLENAFADPKSKAVVIEIESPGGSAIESALIAEHIQKLKQQYGKPVHAYIPRYAASGGLYIAAAADQIHVHPMANVGSVGVIADYGFGAESLLKRADLERRLFTSTGSDLKGAGDQFSKMTPEQIRSIQRNIDDTLENFQGFVKSSRGDRLNAANQDAATVFRGGVINGARAVGAGLADNNFNLEQIMAQYPGSRVIKHYPIRREPTFLEKMGLEAQAIAAGVTSSVVHSGIESLNQEVVNSNVNPALVTRL